MKIKLECPKCKHKIILESQSWEPDTLTTGSYISCDNCGNHFGI